jgi:predicted nucleic acid-binding protein
VTLVLDASLALAWLLKRTKPEEAELAGKCLESVRASGAVVPALWYPEVANSLLLAERQHVIRVDETSEFLWAMSLWEITQDPVPPAESQLQTMYLGRAFKLTAYDATYLELAMRRAAALATFDRKLADAARSAGVPVFGDAA